MLVCILKIIEDCNLDVLFVGDVKFQMNNCLPEVQKTYKSFLIKNKVFYIEDKN